MATVPVPQLSPTSSIPPTPSFPTSIPPPPPHLSPKSVPDPPSSAAPSSDPPSSSGPGPAPAADFSPSDHLASDSPPPPGSSSDLSSFPPLPTSANPILPRSASPSIYSSSIGPEPPLQPSHASVPASMSNRVLPNVLQSSSAAPPLLADPLSSHPVPVSLKSSYAQATRSGRGSGFVRSHAAAVDHFARVPRTGAKIICGSRDGIPSFSFVSSDLSKVEEIYSNALVMKFSGGRPSLEASQKEIISWGMEQSFSIGPLSSRAFLLRFQDDRDLLKVLTRPSSILITFPYKIFRWHNLCHLAEDSSMVPVWISFPRLPMQCFIPEFLETVGNKLGRFLCFDRATTTLARPSVARICVELDLRKSLPQFIWVGLFEGFKQSITYERLPKYCNHCHRLGHATAVCSMPSSVVQTAVAGGRPTKPKERMPAVRDIAVGRHQARVASSSNIPPPPPAHSSLSAVHPPTLQPQPSLGLRTEQGLCNGSSSRTATTSTPPIPESSSASIHPSDAPTLPQLADSAQVHPPISAESQLNPSTNPNTNNRNFKAKKKSVSFILPGQSNLSANIEFWNAVNDKVSISEHNPTSTSSLSIPSNVTASLDPPPTTSQSHHASTTSSAPPFNPSSSEYAVTSDAATSPPASPHSLYHRPIGVVHGHEHPGYASEGEDCSTEPSPMLGHNTDELLDKMPMNSKRNKRHPDQPLKVQLRVRKDPNPSV